MRLILGESLQRIREKIACPQLGDDHYGDWGILSLNQRLAMSEMIETIKFLDKMLEDMLLSKQKEENNMDIHTATEQAYKNGYEKGYADALGGGWISVKDRLPENDDRVLVYLDSERGYTKIDTDGIYYRGGQWVRWGNDVTHWMPLPTPPKGEQK